MTRTREQEGPGRGIGCVGDGLKGGVSGLGLQQPFSPPSRSEGEPAGTVLQDGPPVMSRGLCTRASSSREHESQIPCAQCWVQTAALTGRALPTHPLPIVSDSPAPFPSTRFLRSFLSPLSCESPPTLSAPPTRCDGSSSCLPSPFACEHRAPSTVLSKGWHEAGTARLAGPSLCLSSPGPGETCRA